MPHECYTTAALDELQRHIEAGASIYIKDSTQPALVPLSDGRVNRNLTIDYTTQIKETKDDD